MTRLDGVDSATRSLDTRLMAAGNQATLLGAQVKLLNDSLPELETLVGGQTISASSTNGWLTGAYMANGIQVSKHCSALVYGKTKP